MPSRTLKRFARALVLAMTGLLSACADNRNAEEALALFIATTLERDRVEPMSTPELPVPVTFVYSAAGLRSPFERPPSQEATQRAISVVVPDFTRVRGVLESSQFSELKMVGHFSDGERLLALIETPSGTLFRIGIGGFLGTNHGQVWRVLPDRIDLTEIVPSGDGGWIERPQVLSLTTLDPF